MSIEMLLDRLVTEQEMAEETLRVAQQSRQVKTDYRSAVLCRLGEEWLAIQAASLSRILPARKSHPLPHRRDNGRIQIVNAEGQIIPFIELKSVLGLNSNSDLASDSSGSLLVVGLASRRFCFRVDEVCGLGSYDPAALFRLPGEGLGKYVGYGLGLFSDGQHSWTLLDAERLYQELTNG